MMTARIRKRGYAAAVASAWTYFYRGARQRIPDLWLFYNCHHYSMLRSRTLIATASAAGVSTIIS